MKATTAVVIINTSIWVSTSIAIGIGLYYTKDIKCLWFLLIPTLCRFVTTNKENKNEIDN